MSATGDARARAFGILAPEQAPAIKDQRLPSSMAYAGLARLLAILFHYIAKWLESLGLGFMRC